MKAPYNGIVASPALSIHEDDRGKLMILNQTPFDVKRMFIVTEVTKSRGDHAHRAQKQFFICLRGPITVATISYDNDRGGFVPVSTVLDQGDTLYIDPLVWSSQHYGPNSELLVLCDAPYDESDYIRDLDEFVKIVTQ